MLTRNLRSSYQNSGDTVSVDDFTGDEVVNADESTLRRVLSLRLDAHRC